MLPLSLGPSEPSIGGGMADSAMLNIPSYQRGVS